jgi:hypothetical protein
LAEPEPVLSPKQRTSADVTDMESGGGSEIVTEEDIVHPLPSVVVTVYVPMVRLFSVAFVPPDGAHRYV